MKKAKSVVVSLSVVLVSAAISAAAVRSECFQDCRKERAECMKKIGAMKPYTFEEQQQLDECSAAESDCVSKCADAPPSPEEQPRDEPQGTVQVGDSHPKKAEH